MPTHRQKDLHAQTVVARLHDIGIKVRVEEAFEALHANDGHVGRTINRLKSAKARTAQEEVCSEQQGGP